MSERNIVERLQAPANWLRQDRGVTWKEATNRYDRAPFDAAAEILRLRSELADAKRAGWIAGRDAAAEAVEKRACELDDKMCCNNPRGDREPECCGDPLYMISNEEAARTIRNMEPPK